MNASELTSLALQFDKELTSIRETEKTDFGWYPYGSLNNFIHLEPIFSEFPLSSLMADNQLILDVGGADGDLAFFMESLGYQVNFVDNAPTNFNNLRGVRRLAQVRNSDISISEIDLDTQFQLPITSPINLTFFLGILYHLKNPYYVLEQLAFHSKYMLLSTRIIQFLPDSRPVAGATLAYLVSPTETNNDASNYWMFTLDGLKLICDRTGWDVLYFRTVGDTVASNPRDQDHDERAFLLLKSRRDL